MIARPALPAVLAALLDCRPGEETPAQWLAMPGCALALGDIGGAGRQRDGARFVVPRSPNARFLDPIGMGRDVRRSWITRDPAEAWEILDARGLLPPEGARSFDVGASIATIAHNALRRSYEPFERDLPASFIAARDDIDRDFLDGIRGFAPFHRPVAVPDLVAWASLGADAIVTAEALCREIGPALARIGYGVDRCERVVWRVKDADRRVRGAIVEQWRKDGDAVLMANGTLDIPGGYAAFHRETIAPVRALWDAGLALERVGAECVLCVPPIGGCDVKRYYCGRTGCGIDAEGDRCDECGAPWSAHREIDATLCGSFVRCGRGDRDHGHHCDLAPGHAGPHHTAGCDGGAT